MLTFKDFLSAFNNIWYSPISPIFERKTDWVRNQIHSKNIIVCPNMMIPTNVGCFDRKNNKIYIPERVLEMILDSFKKENDVKEIEAMTHLVNQFLHLK